MTLFVKKLFFMKNIYFLSLLFKFIFYIIYISLYKKIIKCKFINKKIFFYLIIGLTLLFIADYIYIYLIFDDNSYINSVRNPGFLDYKIFLSKNELLKYCTNVVEVNKDPFLNIFYKSTDTYYPSYFVKSNSLDRNFLLNYWSKKDNILSSIESDYVFNINLCLKLEEALKLNKETMELVKSSI